MIAEILPYAVGVIGSLIGVVWAMLNGKIESQTKELAVLRERIADLYKKVETTRERGDGQHLAAMLEVYKK